MPQRVIEAIYEVTKGEAICTADVGQHQMWLAQYYGFKQSRVPTFRPADLAPWASDFRQPSVRRWAARPPGLVHYGRRRFSDEPQELATVKSYNIPVKIAIINNSFLGMVRQWQELFFDRHYSHSDLHTNPDFVKIAEAYGVRGATGDERGGALACAGRGGAPRLDPSCSTST